MLAEGFGVRSGRHHPQRKIIKSRTGCSGSCQHPSLDQRLLRDLTGGSESTTGGVQGRGEAGQQTGPSSVCRRDIHHSPERHSSQDQVATSSSCTSLSGNHWHSTSLLSSSCFSEEGRDRPNLAGGKQSSVVCWEDRRLTEGVRPQHLRD